MKETITVNVDINNVPYDFGGDEKYGYIVARLVDTKLWWYGFYESFKRADEVASELGNGFVLEY